MTADIFESSNSYYFSLRSCVIRMDAQSLELMNLAISSLNLEQLRIEYRVFTDNGFALKTCTECVINE